MNNRKILTLNEILSLDRRPTLQEMVDLSIEDYTKYLYAKGIIKFIPESGSAYDYEDIPDENNIINYDSVDDIILELNLQYILNNGYYNYFVAIFYYLNSFINF